MSTRQETIWFACVSLREDMGGVASVSRSSVAALTGNGLNRIISYYDSPDQRPDWLNSGIKWVGCCGSRLRFITECLKQTILRPNLIVFDHIDIAQSQVLLPRSFRMQFAIWIHGIEVWRQLSIRKARALRQATQLISNSSFTLNKAVGLHGDLSNATVVNLCFEEDAEFESRAITKSSQRPNHMLTVGRLVKDRPKGHLELLAALPWMAQRIPDLVWHIVGSGPWKSELQQLVNESPASDHVVIHGFVDNETLSDLYAECRVFAMPSHGEGFGLVYAEAMRYGTVCVSSDLDAACELVGGTGVVASSLESSKLSDVISRLFEDDDYADRLQAAAAERVAHFSPNRFRDRLLAAIGDR